MDIKELREQIDGIDRQIVELYCRRMDTARAIGRYKRENNLPVLDSQREKVLLDRVSGLAGEENAQGVRDLFRLLIAHSRQRQESDGGAEAAPSAPNAFRAP